MIIINILIFPIFNKAASLGLLISLSIVSLCTLDPAYSLLVSQQRLIRNRNNIIKNAIIINKVSTLTILQLSDQQPENKISDNNRSYNTEEEEKEQSLYDVLESSPTDTRRKLKSQYVKLARVSHPDAQIENGDTIDFQQVAEAWRTLGNPQSRRKYDRELKAKEWGEKAQRLTNERLEQAAPIALNIMDKVAVPFLRRTTATTWAVGRAIKTGLSSSSLTKSLTSMTATEKDYVTSNNDIVNSDKVSASSTIDNAFILDFIDEQVAADDFASNASKQSNATDTLADTFVSVIEAGKQAGRLVDTMELNEKSDELQERAKKEEEKAKHLSDEFDSVKEKRLLAILHSTEFALSSTEAEEVLEKLNDDKVSSANRSMKKTVIEKEILSLRNTEAQFTEQLASYTEIDVEWNEWLIKQEEAKQKLSKNKNIEIEARQALDIAQKMVIEAKDDMVQVSNTLRGVEQEVRKRALEMNRVSTTLSRKQERVRNALRRRTGLLNGGIQVQYITEHEVTMLRRKEIKLVGESKQIATMVARLQSRANKLKKRADSLEQQKDEYNL